MLSRVLRAAIMAVLSVVALSSGPGVGPARALETDWFPIDTIPVEDYFPPRQIQKLIEQTKVTEEELAKAAVKQVQIRVFTPDGGGRSPVVIFLHTCGGVIEEHYESWRPWFMSRGYAFVVVDSFASRNIFDLCEAGAIGRRFFKAPRVGDAYATLYHLIANKEKYRIDPRRVILAGFSHGAEVADWSMMSGVRQRLSRSGRGVARFAGAIAVYPPCGKTRPSVYNPVTIIIGDRDQYAPAEKCASWTKQPPAAGSAPLDVHILVDAEHGFDFSDGEISTMKSRGLSEYSPRARAQAEAIIESFLHGLQARATERIAAVDKIRRVLSGNTLRFQRPDGRTVFQYFAPDGSAPLAVAGGRRFDTLRWHMDEDGALCRTRARGKGEACATIVVEHGDVVFQRGNGKEGRRAALLEGNQVPKSERHSAGGSDAFAGPDASDRPRSRNRRRAPEGRRASDGAQSAGAQTEDPQSGFLDEARIRSIVIGNTLAFRAPADGSDMRVYFAPDGAVELKRASAPDRVIRQRWSFRNDGRLCRTIREDREHCVRVRAPASGGDGALTFVNRRGDYRVTVAPGRRLSE